MIFTCSLDIIADSMAEAQLKLTKRCISALETERSVTSVFSIKAHNYVDVEEAADAAENSGTGEGADAQN